MKRFALVVATASSLTTAANAGPYAPAAGVSGSTALAHDDPRIVAWGSAVGSLVRGAVDISRPDFGPVDWGEGTDALGPADAQDDSLPVVSLGDGGSITLRFAVPITNGAGFDFAVFENGITDTFLELAFVEVSSDGSHFVRFPSHSVTQIATQVAGFGALDPTNLDGLAGKYRRGFGTPFDLGVLAGLDPLLDVTRVTDVRVVDVVGSIDPAYATRDSTDRIINDPWATPFGTGGFDLDAIGVLHVIPEPGSFSLWSAGMLLLAGRRFRR